MKKKIIAIAAIAGVCVVAQADDIYWNGAGTGWELTSNWSAVSNAATPNPAAMPGALDTAIFNITTVNSAQTVNLNANRDAQGLIFNNTGTTTLAGGDGHRTLTLGGGGITVHSGAGDVVIGVSATRVGVTLSSSQTWLNNSAGNLNKATLSAVSLDANTLTLNNTGSGQIQIGSPISGTGSVVVNGDSSFNGNGSFTGGLTLNSGTMSVFGNDAAMGAGTVTINSGALNQANSTARNYANSIAVGGNFSLTGVSGAATLSGSIDLGAAIRTITADAGWALSGVIFNGGLTKDGVNALTLSNANTYALGTTVSAGTLIGAADGALGSGDVTVAAGATLTLTGGTANDYISDKKSLILNSTSTLNLDFTGADKVRGVSLDGGTTWLPAGTYDAVALSGLGSGTYTGTGSLTVSLRVLRLIGLTAP